MIYLSEMAISDAHGGGITVQRVLGPAVDEIALCVHVSGFALDHPAIESLRARTKNYPMWSETAPARRLVGSTLASKMTSVPALRRRHASAIVRDLQAHAAIVRNAHLLVCPQSDLSLRVVGELRQVLEVSYVTWIMDDHLVRFINGEWTYRHDHRRAMERHLREAEAIFVISDALGDLYRRQFGVESTVLFGPCDPVGEPVWHPSAEGLKLAYFGAVTEWQFDALAAVASSIRATPAAVLDVFSPSRPLPSAFRVRGVHEKAPVEKTDVVRAMRSYDAIVLPISFDPRMRHLSELNIATKMAECVASGTVTLVIGPEYSAMVRYLRANDAAVVVTSPAAEAIAAGLREVKNVRRRAEVLRSARELAVKELAAAPMRARWERHLSRPAAVKATA